MSALQFGKSLLLRGYQFCPLILHLWHRMMDCCPFMLPKNQVYAMPSSNPLPSFALTMQQIIFQAQQWWRGCPWSLYFVTGPCRVSCPLRQSEHVVTGTWLLLWSRRGAAGVCYSRMCNSFCAWIIVHLGGVGIYFSGRNFICISAGYLNHLWPCRQLDTRLQA